MNENLEKDINTVETPLKPAPPVSPVPPVNMEAEAKEEIVVEQPVVEETVTTVSEMPTIIEENLPKIEETSVTQQSQVVEPTINEPEQPVVQPTVQVEQVVNPAPIVEQANTDSTEKQLEPVVEVQQEQTPVEESKVIEQPVVESLVQNNIVPEQKEAKKEKGIVLEIIKKCIPYLIVLVLLAVGCWYVKGNSELMQKVWDIDLEINNTVLNKIQNDRLTALMKFITLFGSAYVLIGITVVTIIGMKKRKYGITLASGLTTTFLINYLLKNIFKKARPVFAIGTASGYSFPSSHVMCSMIVYGLFYVILSKNSSYFTVTALYLMLSIVLIVAVGVSRLYLGVHFLSDIVMGYVFGFVLLLMFKKIMRIVTKKD